MTGEREVNLRTFLAKKEPRVGQRGRALTVVMCLDSNRGIIKPSTGVVASRESSCIYIELKHNPINRPEVVMSFAKGCSTNVVK